MEYNTNIRITQEVAAVAVGVVVEVVEVWDLVSRVLLLTKEAAPSTPPGDL